MIANKHISKWIAAGMAVAVCICLAAAWMVKTQPVSADTGILMEYEEKLFNTNETIRVNITMPEEDWEKMLENAISEEYYQCDVEINGSNFYRVGIRPKGNTSLSSIAMDPTTDRYSFKLEFDQYVDGQTCFGLDKLILNNNYADATNMKEAMIYDMFQYLGADASLYNYAEVYVNDEYRGVYLALEAVEDSFLLRNYGAAGGNIYKPESMELGGQDGQKGFQGEMPEGGMPDRMQMDDMSGDGMPDRMQMDDMPEDGMPGGGHMRGASGGSDLNYSDDDLDSYSSIWEGAVGSTSESDHRRVLKALKNISEGNDPETYMDIDNLLRYMAVHVFSVNEDSLSGSMAHNYYLYEKNGQLNLFPWDYNLAFGGMDVGGNMRDHGNVDTATSIVNDPIDTPFDSTNFFDILLEDEDYCAEYYAYLETLVKEYVYGGGFEDFYQRTRNLIDSLVETDPTAFYSYEEYLAAVEMFHDIVLLRADSISGQIEGSIPSTSSGQTAEPESLIDASSIDISIMGSMHSGNDEMGRPGISENEGGVSHGEMPFHDGDARPAMGGNVQDADSKPDSFPGSFSEGDMFPDSGEAKQTSYEAVLTIISFILLIIAIAIASGYRRKRFRR